MSPAKCQPKLARLSYSLAIARSLWFISLSRTTKGGNPLQAWTTLVYALTNYFELCLHSPPQHSLWLIPATRRSCHSSTRLGETTHPKDRQRESQERVDCIDISIINVYFQWTCVNSIIIIMLFISINALRLLNLQKNVACCLFVRIPLFVCFSSVLSFCLNQNSRINVRII